MVRMSESDERSWRKVLATVRGHASVLRGGGILLAGRLVFVGSSFLVSAILARAMSKAELAEQIYLQGLATVLGLVAGLECGQAAAQQIGFARTARPAAVGPILRSAQFGALVGGVVLGLGLATFLFVTASQHRSAMWLLAMAGFAYTLAFAVRSIGARCFIALSRLSTAAFLDGALGTAFALVACATLYLLRGHISLRSALVITAASYGVEAIVSSWLMTRAWSQFSRADLGGLERYPWLTLAKVGFPLMLATAITQASAQIPIWVLMAGSRAAEAAAFNLTTRATTLVGIIILVVNQASTPRLSRAIATEDRAALKRQLDLFSLATFGLAAAAATPMLFCPRLVLTLFFGQGFQIASSAMMILAAAQLIESAAGPSQLILILSGRQRLAFAIIASSCALVFPLMLVFQRFGGVVEAAAVALAAPMAMRAIVTAVIVRTLVRGRQKRTTPLLQGQPATLPESV
jgi:O-antigen/teichoic acid export membrane protein